MSDESISVLIVEDDADFRDSSARWMQRKGHDVAAAASGAEALSLCSRQDFDVGVFDMNMPGMSGIELLQRIRDESIDIEVIILTGQGTIETTVQAMKMGASDYLTKPCPLGDLAHHCRLARDRGRLRKENKQLKAIISRGHTKTELIGDSLPMRDVSKLIERIAPTDKPVLLPARVERARRSLPKPFSKKASLQINRLSPSTVRHYRNSWSKANCLVIKKDHSPARRRTSRDCSRSLIAERCSSTSSARCQSRCNRNCFEFWKTVRCVESDPTKNVT